MYLKSGNATPQNVDQKEYHFTDQHLSAEDAGDIAQKAGVKKLIFTHLALPGLSDPAVLQKFLDDAHRKSDGELVVASDVQKFSL